MFRILCVLTLLIAAAPTLRADDDDPPPPGHGQGKHPAVRPRLTPAIAADAVLKALEAQDAERLAAMAASHTPDPWLVADELCRRGQHDAALAFARVGKTAYLARLPAYVEARRQAGAETEARAALEAARRSMLHRGYDGVLEATEPYESGPRTVTGVRLLEARAAALTQLRRRIDSATMLHRAGVAAADMGWTMKAAQALMRSAAQAAGERTWAQALETYSALHALQTELQNEFGRAFALHRMAMLLTWLGRHVEAQASYEAATAIYRAKDDRIGQATVQSDAAGLYEEMGDLPRAMAAYDESAAVLERHQRHRDLARVLHNSASLLQRTGRLEEALERLERSHAISKARGFGGGAILTMGAIGTVLARMGRNEEALARWEEARKQATEAGDRMQAAHFTDNIGTHLVQRGRHEEARGYLETALKAFDELDSPVAWARTAATLAACEQADGRYEQAQAACEAALERVTKTEALETRVLCHWGVAAAQLSRGQAAEAAASARLGVELVTHAATGLAEHESAAWRETYAGLFDVGMRATHRLQDTEAFAWFLEHARAGSLREALGTRVAVQANVIPESLRADLLAARDEEQRAVKRYQALSSSTPLRTRRAAKRAMRAARSRVQEATDRIEREERAAAALVFPQPDDLGTIRTRIAPSQAFVLYAVTPGAAFALVARRDGARTLALPDPGGLHAALQALALDDPKTDSAEVLARLRSVLAAPLGLGEDVEQVVVVPDGRLAYVPFALLFPHRTVSCTPSATTHGFLMETAAQASRGVLALGDPDYESHSKVARAFHRGARAGALAPLPATREEVAAIGTTTLLGSAASEAGLSEALGTQERWRAVHFACHGLVDPENPQRSSLALSADARNDGFLTGLEVLRMRIRADLVVLSACETARGRVYLAEGVIGLSRAFMHAGAPRVLASLWKVDDEATRALMVRFYSLWNPRDGSPGIPASAALRQAQDHVRAQPRWRHPYYWAAWILWGLP